MKWQRGLAGVPDVSDTRSKMKGAHEVEHCWNRVYDSGSIVMTSGQRPKMYFLASPGSWHSGIIIIIQVHFLGFRCLESDCGLSMVDLVMHAG